ncbi:uncharacterized protein LOC141903955 [Tubulanus polymorphus]|uniref:uncharacterized protein LOC141903955 n=1 Tax=Tubulanus polymorphus TaxID=672921 RepID=UPI003DA2F0CC
MDRSSSRVIELHTTNENDDNIDTKKLLRVGVIEIVFGFLVLLIGVVTAILLVNIIYHLWFAVLIMLFAGLTVHAHRVKTKNWFTAAMAFGILNFVFSIFVIVWDFVCLGVVHTAFQNDTATATNRPFGVAANAVQDDSIFDALYSLEIIFCAVIFITSFFHIINAADLRKELEKSEGTEN